MRGIVCLGAILVVTAAHSQTPVQREIIELALKATRQSCTNSTKTVDSVDISIGPVIRRLTAEGKLALSASEMNGAIGYSDEQIRATRDASIQRCMTATLPTYLELFLGNKPKDYPPPGGSGSLPTTLPSTASDECDYIAPGFNVECKTDFAGFVVDRKEPPFYTAGSVERCAAFCRARTDCVAFNYNLRSRSNCFLYKRVGEKRYNESIVSGFK